MQPVNRSDLIREPTSENTFKSTGQSMKTHWVKVNYTIVVVSRTQKIKKRKEIETGCFQRPPLEWIYPNYLFSVFPKWIGLFSACGATQYRIFITSILVYIIIRFILFSAFHFLTYIRDMFISWFFKIFPSYIHRISSCIILYSFLLLINKYVSFNYINYVYWHNEVFPFDPVVPVWFNWKNASGLDHFGIIE